MKIYGHPWSINTRKTLAVFAEKNRDVTLSLVMIPKGEHKHPDHLRVHPFGKVPVLDDNGFVLYETRAINAYVDAVLDGPSLVPSNARDRARMDQWINVADSYFIPFAHPLIVEVLFRRFLGGVRDEAVVAAGRAGIVPALDTIDCALAKSPFLAGDAYSLADIHWSPYLEYMMAIGEGGPIDARANVRAWWARISARAAWKKAARTGPQPYDEGVTAGVIETLYR